MDVKPDAAPVPVVSGYYLYEGPYFARYAGFASRLLAMMIDLLIVAVIWIFWGLTFSFLGRTSGINELLSLVGNFFLWITPYRSIVSIALEVSALLLVAQIYFTFFYGFGGATIGKYLMGLRVIRRNGQPLSLARAALRTLAYTVSSLVIYAGFFNILLDERRRAWHDILLGTVVVHTWQGSPDEAEL